MAERLEIILSATDGASGILHGVTGALGGLGNIITTGLGMALGNVLTGGLNAVTGALGDMWNGAMEAQQISAQLDAVLRSTGGAAGMTRDELIDLADSLASTTAFEDDAILSAENLLLTFTNIGSETFPAATQALLDMGAAMGGDPKQQAIQLGKALNDPVAGISALTRVGVTFTEEQKKVIESLVKTGDVAGAQRIILDELNKEFGGSAAAQLDTFSGRWQNFQNQLSNVGETVIGALLPTLTTLLSNVIVPALPYVEAIATELGYFISGASDGSDLFAALSDAILAAFGPETGGQIMTVIGQIWDGLAQFQGWLVENWPQISATISQVLGEVMAFITGTVVPFITGTLIPIIASVVEWVVTNWPQISATIQTVIETVSEIVTTVMTAIQEFWAANGEQIMATASSIWTGIQQVVTDVITIVSTIVTSVVTALSAFWQQNHEQIMAVATNIWNIIYTTVSTIINLVAEIIHAVSLAITGDWQGFGDTLSQIWNTLWEGIKTILTNAWQALSTIVTGLINTIVGAFNSIDWPGLGNAIIHGIGDGISSAVQWLVDQAVAAAQAAFNAVKSALGIQSPSLLFAEGVGKPIAQGIALGIADNMGLVESALSDVAGLGSDFSRWGARGDSRFGGPASRLPPGGGFGRGGGVTMDTAAAKLLKAAELLIAFAGSDVEPAFDAAFAVA